MDESSGNITRLHINADNFLNCVVNIYGPTNSGKTAVARDVIFNLKDKIPMGFVFCPSNPSHKGYDGYFPDLAIITDTDPDLLETKIERIYKRQEMATTMYKCANNVTTLHKIYMKVQTSNSSSVLTRLGAAENRLTHALRKLKREADDEVRSSQSSARPKTKFYQKEKERIESGLLRARIAFYKSIIYPNKSTLLKNSHILTDEEKYAINYLHINPNVLLIFDDVMDELKPLLKVLIPTIVHKCRHVYETIVFLMHDDTGLTRDLRKQPRYSIFTKAATAEAYVRRKDNNVDVGDVKRIGEICKKIWRPETEHRKLVYCNQASENQFRYIDYTWLTEKFRFGSDEYWDFCEKAKSSGAAVDKTNPFYSSFK